MRVGYYRLMRQTKFLLATLVVPRSTSLCRLLRAPAGRWTSRDVISAICVKVLGSVPRHDRAVHVSVSSCSTSVSPEGQEDRLVRYPAKQLHCGGRFRGCNHSLMFRLLYLLDPLTVPTKGLHVPLGHRAVYTGQNLFPYRTQAPALLRVRNRTIDTAGLAAALATTHLLDRSLVGCS